MVMVVDDERVTEQLLQQLLKFLPGPDQMKQLQDMKGMIKDLSDAEQFCAVVSYQLSVCVCVCVCVCV